MGSQSRFSVVVLSPQEKKLLIMFSALFVLLSISLAKGFRENPEIPEETSIIPVESSGRDSQFWRLSEDQIKLLESLRPSNSTAAPTMEPPTILDAVFQICEKDNELIFVDITVNQQFVNVFSCDESLTNATLRSAKDGYSFVLDNAGIKRVSRGFMRAEGVNFVSLERNNFTDVKPEFFVDSKMNSLHLAENSIVFIKNGSFVNKYVEWLNLRANLIATIEPGAFTEMTNMNWLTLGHNNLSDVSFATGLPPTLKDLGLEDNHISKIPTNSFHALKHLRKLNLTANSIEELEPGAFNGVESVEMIFLDANRLKAVENGVFDGLRNMVYLHLTRNKITRIDRNAFKDLAKLDVLELSENKITELIPGTFENLSRLTELKCAGNKLHSIAKGAFIGLENLNSLHFERNQITRIEPGALGDLANVKWLFLQSNKLQKLEADTFKGLINLEILDFTSNQLTRMEPGLFDGLTKLSTSWIDYNNASQSVKLEESLLSSNQTSHPKLESDDSSMSSQNASTRISTSPQSQ